MYKHILKSLKSGYALPYNIGVHYSGIVRELATNGFIRIYNYALNEYFNYSIAAIDGAYFIQKDYLDEPNTELFYKKYMGSLSVNEATFNMIDGDKELAFKKWNEENESSYNLWVEKYKDELEFNKNLSLEIDEDLINYMDNFDELYLEYIMSKQWYIDNVLLREAKNIVYQEIISLDRDSREYRFLTKFYHKLSAFDDNGCVQIVEY